MITRPTVVTDAMLTYLDRLQESGETNMFGAGEYVQNKFGLTRATAKEVVLYWMGSYESTWAARNPGK